MDPFYSPSGSLQTSTQPFGSGGCFQLLQGQLDGGVTIARCRVDGIKLAQALIQIDRHALVHSKGAHTVGCMTHIGLHLIVGDHFGLDVEQALVLVVVQLCRALGDDEHRLFALQNRQRFGDAGRHEIIERYRPGEDDPHLKVLQAAHISDDEYFSHMVLDDLSLIIRDIREAHKKDSESTPQTAVAWFVGFHVAAVRAVVIQLILYKAINCKLSIAT